MESNMTEPMNEEAAMKFVEKTFGTSIDKIQEKRDRVPFIAESLERGIERIRRTNLSDAADRLEVVVEKNPEINPERIAMPKELHLMRWYVRRFDASMNLKRTATNFGLGAINGILGMYIYEFLQNSQDAHPAAYLIPAAQAAITSIDLFTGARCAIDFIRNYIRDRKEGVFLKPLNPRETQLSDYVYCRATAVEQEQDD